MSDGITLNAGTGGVTLASDDIGGSHYQLIKVTYGALDSATLVDTTNRFPTSAAQSGTWTVQPGNTANTTAWLVTGTGGTFPVTDSAGSLTVDAPVGTPVFVRLSDGAAAITNLAVNNAQINGVTPLMGNGASGTGCQRVTIANDSTGVLATVTTLTNITNWGNIVDDAAFTPGTTRVLMAGFQADETATDSVDEGDGGAARMTLDRKAIVTQHPHTQGGLSSATGSITNTATAIKASAGQVYGWYFYNPNSSVAYVQFFNTAAASVTVGTTAPVYSLGIPATSGANVMMNCGVAHSTAISIAVTTTRAGSTAPSSSVDYNIFYF